MALVIKASKAVIDWIRTENLLDDLLHEAARAELEEKARELDAAFMGDWDKQEEFWRELERKSLEPYEKMLTETCSKDADKDRKMSGLPTPETRAAIDREWAMIQELPPGRVSLKRYKTILRAANRGTFSETELADQEQRLDETFTREAARDRVHEWEGVWLWD